MKSVTFFFISAQAEMHALRFCMANSYKLPLPVGRTINDDDDDDNLKLKGESKFQMYALKINHGDEKFSLLFFPLFFPNGMAIHAYI